MYTLNVLDKCIFSVHIIVSRGLFNNPNGIVRSFVISKHFSIHMITLDALSSKFISVRQLYRPTTDR